MEIKHITHEKKDFLDLLLLADECEKMIERYLDRGEMFALYDEGLKSICVVTQEGQGLYEIKNLATCPPFQRRGYARKLIEYVESLYPSGATLQVGTGDSPLTIPFYERCDFIGVFRSVVNEVHSMHLRRYGIEILFETVDVRVERYDACTDTSHGKHAHRPLGL